jgi:hypothetical protein
MMIMNINFKLTQRKNIVANMTQLGKGSVTHVPVATDKTVIHELFEMVIHIRFAWTLVQFSSVQVSSVTSDSSFGILKRVVIQS